ncbi:hypothetical protein AB0870_02335 [Microbacterium proteolyticum]|uniref:hypothetical protein n=1 Tax=Microbacterium proteolyticum TaxID=1572644 RepID=UPI0024166315|nr:hypothetical protein [Microbacterium proteolyticum]
MMAVAVVFAFAGARALIAFGTLATLITLLSHAVMHFNLDQAIPNCDRFRDIGEVRASDFPVALPAGGTLRGCDPGRPNGCSGRSLEHLAVGRFVALWATQTSHLDPAVKRAHDSCHHDGKIS